MAKLGDMDITIKLDDESKEVTGEIREILEDCRASLKNIENILRQINLRDMRDRDHIYVERPPRLGEKDKI